MSKKPLLTGQVIAQRYDVLAVIGRGGQGTVYRAFDRWMQRTVAVKVLGANAARDATVLERLMREQQAMQALRGTAAVEVFDTCRHSGGEICLVMELLVGEDLDQYLDELAQRDRRVPVTRIVDIVEPIVSTLEAAHACGIIHRDLKPANIFLLDDGSVRLLDFGLARLKSAVPLTAAGTVVGSPSFMAPEAWSGLSDFMDQRADVYSLGVILFLMMTGQLPFSGTSVHDKYLSATTGCRASLLQFRPDLPRGIEEWASLALARDREQRFQNVTALWSAFLATFNLQRRNRGKQESVWAAAATALRRLVGSHRAAPPHAPPANAPRLETGDPIAVERMRPQLRSPRSPSPRRHSPRAESTLSMSASDLISATPPA